MTIKYSIGETSDEQESYFFRIDEGTYEGVVFEIAPPKLQEDGTVKLTPLLIERIEEDQKDDFFENALIPVVDNFLELVVASNNYKTK